MRLSAFIRNLPVFISIAIIIAACSNNSEPLAVSGKSINNSSSSRPSEQNNTIGGWAPAFFTNMDESQLNSIAEGLNSGQIKRVVISYPTKMESLAEQIHDYLQQQTDLDLPLKSIELKDTEQVKYNLTQVILTLYFN